MNNSFIITFPKLESVWNDLSSNRINGFTVTKLFEVVADSFKMIAPMSGYTELRTRSITDFIDNENLTKMYYVGSTCGFIGILRQSKLTVSDSCSELHYDPTTNKLTFTYPDILVGSVKVARNEIETIDNDMYNIIVSFRDHYDEFKELLNSDPDYVLAPFKLIELFNSLYQPLSDTVRECHELVRRYHQLTMIDSTNYIAFHVLDKEFDKDGDNVFNTLRNMFLKNDSKMMIDVCKYLVYKCYNHSRERFTKLLNEVSNGDDIFDNMLLSIGNQYNLRC